MDQSICLDFVSISFVVVNIPFVVVDIPFMVMGVPFMVVDIPFMVMGVPFMVIDIPFMVMGVPFMVIGISFVDLVPQEFMSQSIFKKCKFNVKNILFLRFHFYEDEILELCVRLAIVCIYLV